MDESDRRKIKENIDALVDVLDYASLLPLLQMKRIFTRSMIEAFDGHQHLEHRKFAMLCDLCKRGPNAFEDFIDCLQMTEQTEAIRLLKPEALTPENMQRRCSLFPVRRGMIIYPSCSPFLNDDQNPDRYYKMTSNPRGYALIVNIRSFAYVNIERIGSEMDVKRLARVFRRLHYDVVVKDNDPKSDELVEFFNDYSKREELNQHDSIVIVIMTHGGSYGSCDFIYAADDVPIEVDECIIQKFNAANCPQLSNKPKLFFIESCRGDRDDKGVPVSDINRNIQDMQINCTLSETCAFPPQNGTQRMRNDPTYGDILISNATVFGYRAYLNTCHGSWFMQALAFCLWHHAHDKHIEEILCCVQNKVRDLQTEDEFVQCTSYSNQGFYKKFYFNPGYFA